MGIKVVTDSTSYIPKEYIEKYDIRVVSLNVIMNGISEREVEINDEVFYEKMELSSEIPTSSQPSTEEFYNVFEEIIKEGHSVLGIFLSSKMSGTYSTAFLIKDMILENYPNAEIEIIDSMNTTMAMGFSVVDAARKAIETSKTLGEIKAEAKEIIEKSDILFSPGGLKHFKKGGRIGAASALIGGILQIIPILHVKYGEVEVLDKVRTKKKAINQMLKIIGDKMKNKGITEAVVYHILNKSEAIDLKKRLKLELKIDAKIMDIGPIVGLHVGPGSIGIAYYTK
ncbi:DegV family protein [Clostridium sp.]|uniref:DegV family protein n=1 Tax=Clostridium sp. TaxID=1506 RepID=UPI0039942DEB